MNRLWSQEIKICDELSLSANTIICLDSYYFHPNWEYTIFWNEDNYPKYDKSIGTSVRYSAEMTRKIWKRAIVWPHERRHCISKTIVFTNCIRLWLRGTSCPLAIEKFVYTWTCGGIGVEKTLSLTITKKKHKRKWWEGKLERADHSPWNFP